MRLDEQHHVCLLKWRSTSELNRKRVLAHSTDFPGRTHHRQGSCSTCSEKSPGRWGISSDLSPDRWCPSSVCLPYLALSRELEDDVRIELNPSCNGQSAFEAVPAPSRFIIHGARGRTRTPHLLHRPLLVRESNPRLPKLVVRVGFEPTARVSPSNTLAGCRFKPLIHLTNFFPAQYSNCYSCIPSRKIYM